MTISTPAKVKTLVGDQPVEVLAANIDTLDLAIDVKWPDSKFIENLDAWKKYALEKGRPVGCPIKLREDREVMFNIRPNGTGTGYAYILYNKDFTLRIGSWLSPISRPSIMAQVHSEALWREGPEAAVSAFMALLQIQGARIVKSCVSRVDLCVDVLLPESLWTIDLMPFRVTRARYLGIHQSDKKLTGVQIGRGKIGCRIYDKPLEISQKSKKTWMYPIWGIDEVPDGHRVIRVEFQLRREAIKEIGIDSHQDLFENIRGVWAYCTEKWLKFRSRPGEHHTMRKTFAWWISVQEGFEHLPDGQPLVREESFRKNEEQYFAQIYGQMTALRALKMEERGLEIDDFTTPDDLVDTFRRSLLMSGKDRDQISIDVFRKREKFHQAANPDWKASESMEKAIAR
jgi:hypothetical protein